MSTKRSWWRLFDTSEASTPVQPCAVPTAASHPPRQHPLRAQPAGTRPPPRRRWAGWGRAPGCRLPQGDLPARPGRPQARERAPPGPGRLLGRWPSLRRSWPAAHRLAAACDRTAMRCQAPDAAPALAAGRRRLGRLPPAAGPAGHSKKDAEAREQPSTRWCWRQLRRFKDCASSWGLGGAWELQRVCCSWGSRGGQSRESNSPMQPWFA